MAAIFNAIVEMSLRAVPVICVLFVLRGLLSRAPKRFSYALWAIAAFRLLCPVSVTSVFSLFNLRVDKVPSLSVAGEALPTVEDPALKNDVPAVPETIITLPEQGITVEQTVTNPTVEVHSFNWDVFLSVVWVIGVVLILAVCLYQFLRLWKRTRGAVCMENGIWVCDNIPGPFVMGLVRPKIFLPEWLGEAERTYVLAHERFHLKRFDNWVKALCQIILALHWFNPFVWLMLWAVDRDMELSCDEGALKTLGGDCRKDYSRTLLALGAKRREFGPVLAFGTPAVKRRIVNALNFKKTKRVTVVLAILVVLVAALTCCTDATKQEEKSYAEQLWAAQTRYVGNNSAVSALAELAVGEDKGVGVEKIVLSTDDEPYGMTIILTNDGAPVLEDRDYFRISTIMLALVGNLSWCEVEYFDSSAILTMQQAQNWLDKEYLKNSAVSADEVQTLLDAIDALETYPAATESKFTEAYNEQLQSMAQALSGRQIASVQDTQAVLALLDTLMGDTDQRQYWIYNGGYGIEVQRLITESQKGSWDETKIFRAAVLLMALVDDLYVCEFDYAVQHADPTDGTSYFGVGVPITYNLSQIQTLLALDDLKATAKTAGGLYVILNNLETLLENNQIYQINQWCNTGGDGEDEVYTLITDEEGLTMPTVRLWSDGEFDLLFSSLTSQTYHGNYVEKDGILTMMRYNGEDVYYFRRIDAETIEYIAEGSSYFDQFPAHDILVEDGARFGYDLVRSTYAVSAESLVNYHRLDSMSDLERVKELYALACGYAFSEYQLDARSGEEPSILSVSGPLPADMTEQEARQHLFRAGVMMLALCDDLQEIIQYYQRNAENTLQYATMELGVEDVERELNISNLKQYGTSPEQLAQLAAMVEEYLRSHNLSQQSSDAPATESDKYIMSGGRYEIQGYDVAMLSWMPSGVGRKGDLYFAEPAFLNDWFVGKSVEGYAYWADPTKEVLCWGFLWYAGEEEGTLDFSVRLEDGTIQTRAFSSMEGLRDALTDEEAVEIARTLAEIIQDTEDYIAQQTGN